MRNLNDLMTPIVTKLESLKSAYSNEREILNNQLKDIASDLIESDFKDAINSVESSNNFDVSDDCDGWVVSWSRCEALSKVPSELQDAFKDVMRDLYCYDVSFEHNTLIVNQGPSLIILDSGEVYDQDSRKTVMIRSDYKVNGDLDLMLRNELIEAHMEKTGHFPGVFEIDRYNNVTHVKTNKT